MIDFIVYILIVLEEKNSEVQVLTLEIYLYKS